MPSSLTTFTREEVTRLWFLRQGLTQADRQKRLNKKAFVSHLETTGALQVDSVNVVDRAHYLTLWSRFGAFKRKTVDAWVYQDKLAYEYWCHEASIVPMSHLPTGLRRMRRFPPDRWKNSSYWKHYKTSPASKRRVMDLMKRHGPLESTDFERTADDLKQQKILGWGSVIPKEDKRTLGLMWHSGKVAICGRRHFRKVFDLAERVYPDVDPVTTQQYHDSWLLIGLSGCGIASESHLVNYVTGPNLKSDERAQSIKRNLRSKRIVEVQVEGRKERYFALPECLEQVAGAPEPHGTTLVCPFDSFLWQRKRAEELLGFRYRVEIYVPEHKREFGYYVMPILHDGRLVGRVDPKFHRDQQRLEIRRLSLEPGFKSSRSFRTKLEEAVESLAEFLGADQVDLPRRPT